MEEGDEVVDVGAGSRRGVGGGAVRLPAGRLEGGGRGEGSRPGVLGCVAVGNVGAGHRRSSGARPRRLEPELKMPKSVRTEEERQRERDLGVM